MKFQKKSIALIMILAACAFAACGGGGSSSKGGGGTAAGTFTKTVEMTLTPNQNNGMFSTDPFHHYQILYKAADIAGSGNIRSIQFKYDADLTSALTCPHVTIKLAHTNVADLVTDMTQNIKDKGSAVTVLNDATFTIPAGLATNYFEIPLSSQFNYNGVDNLVVDITRAEACLNSVALTGGSATVAYQALMRSGSSATPDTGTHWSNNTSHIKFVFAGGDNIALTGTSTLYLYPFTILSNYQKVQILYFSNEINGSGTITGIAFPVGTATTAEMIYTVNIKLGHTNLTVLTDTFANNFNIGSPVAVSNGVTFKIPDKTPAGTYVWLPISEGTFSYDGINNLIIEIQVTSASGSFYPQSNDSGTTARRLSSSVASSSGYLSDVGYGIKFRFNGGTMDVITDGGHSDDRFFPVSSATGFASLFRVTELGTGGTITSIAFRAQNNTVTGNYPSFKVIIGHTALDALSNSATDFISQNTAYSSLYTIPNTLLKGDWIEIPLSTPFVYDGTHNLIVWVGTTAADGTGSNRCSYSNYSNAYHSHAGNGAPGVSYGGLGDLKTDIQMKISK
jgi:hypothetical protein